VSITLFHVAWCPECEVVRRKLADLAVSYEDIIVPDSRSRRKQVHEVSGQYYVPVIKDGDLVLTETADILAYLDQQYGADGGDTQGRKRFRSQACPTPKAASEDDEHPSCRIT